MTGEPKPEDEPDFLDDFILEDVPAAKDLESMFDPQAAGETPPATPPTGEDALFVDHTQAAGAASEKFEGGPPFSETSGSTWRGEELELDQEGAAKGANERANQAAEEAEATFAKQRDSLLNREDEFAIEPDKDLEIDETDDSLLDEAASAAEATEADATDGTEAMPLEVAEEQAPIEPGWEPLEGANLDQLAEVGGVQRVEGEGEAATEWEDTAAAAAATAEAEEMYAEAADAPAGVVGGRRPVSVLRLCASLAASVAIVAAGALIVWKPEWLGLRAETEQVATVQVQRPRLEVTVEVPPMPLPEVAAAPTPTVTDPTPGQVVDPTPSVVTNDPPPVTPTVEDPVQPTPTTPETGQPAVVNVPSPVDAQKNWPVPVIGPTPADPSNPFAGAPGLREGLVRIGDDMLVGNPTEAGPVPVDGMMPGSKAFAQLLNGNYFIGSVKTVDSVSITLRLTVGEVTLARASLARLTALGSTDYEELQRVTSGFVRLRNNNRLVGSILSSIADDHVVLEFRSNRVMVPKNAIDEVVTGEGDGDVRLGTTPQEDDWVRQLAERQLGQPVPPAGTGAVNAAPPAPPRSGK